MVVGGGIFALRRPRPYSLHWRGGWPYKKRRSTPRRDPPHSPFLVMSGQGGSEGTWAGGFRPAPTDGRASARMALRAMAPTILSFLRVSVRPAGDPSGYPASVGVACNPP